MKTFLFIQLYRYGDIVQSTPAIAAIRQANPDSRIAVLVRKPHANVLAGNPDVDEVIEWDTDALCTDGDEGIRCAPGSKELLREFVRELRRRKFHTIFNLSNDAPSALLTYLLDPRNAVGRVFCRDRRYRVRNHWIRYLFLAGEMPHMNALNLADIFIEACASGQETRPTVCTCADDEHYAEEILRKHYRSGARPIAIQAGAGKGYKRWPAQYFVELAATITRNSGDLLFLGTQDERNYIRNVIESLPSGGAAVNLAGKTTFPQLAALLKRCRYLVANDTATTQVAAATHTPCLLMTYGPIWGAETAPYGDGHYVLEPTISCFPCSADRFCSGLPCRDLLTVDAALAAIRCMQSGGEIIPTALRTNDVVLSRSTWMPDGMLGLEPVNKPALTFQTLLRTMLRSYLLTSALPLKRPVPDPHWRPWTREVFDWYRVEDATSLVEHATCAHKDLASLQKGAEAALQTARTAATGNAVGNPAGEALERLLRALSRAEEQILESEGNEVVQFLVASFRHALRNMDDLPPRQSARALCVHYHALSRGCVFLQNALREFMECITMGSEKALPAAALA